MAVVERLRPDAVLLENVPDLPTWDDGAVLVRFLSGSFGDLGYSVDAQIFDCYRSRGAAASRTAVPRRNGRLRRV